MNFFCWVIKLRKKIWIKKGKDSGEDITRCTICNRLFYQFYMIHSTYIDYYMYITITTTKKWKMVLHHQILGRRLHTAVFNTLFTENSTFPFTHLTYAMAVFTAAPTCLSTTYNPHYASTNQCPSTHSTSTSVTFASATSTSTSSTSTSYANTSTSSSSN